MKAGNLRSELEENPTRLGAVGEDESHGPGRYQHAAPRDWMQQGNANAENQILGRDETIAWPHLGESGGGMDV